MGWTALLAALKHQGGAADPALLEWIKDTLDHLLGLGPWSVIISLGLIIVLLPLLIMVFYTLQLRKDASRNPRE